MNELITGVNSPWLLWILAGSTVGYTVLRQAAESSSFISQLLGPIGRKWTASRKVRRDEATLLIRLQSVVDDQVKELSALKERSRSDAWSNDLKRQVDSLDKAVKELRRRNQIVDAYLVYDEDWHRKEMLAFGADGYIMAPHKSYLEFEQDWVNKTLQGGRRKND